jgi:hypothetical protein
MKKTNTTLKQIPEKVVWEALSEKTFKFSSKRRE